MTSLLKDVMTERADAVETPAVDIEGIIRAGDRRIRRRRVTRTMLAAAAGVALVTTGLVTLDRPGVPPATTAAFAERRPTYGLGDRIVYGSEVINLGEQRMVAFVQTDGGFVFTQRDGDVFLADGIRVIRIGTGNRSHRLAADDSGGTLASWVDNQHLVVYDTAKDQEVARVSAPAPPSTPPPTPGQDDPAARRRLPAALAVDDGKVYFLAADGVRRWDVEAATGKLVKAGVERQWLQDVAAGYLTFVSPQGLVVARDPGSTQPRFDGSHAHLSPLGTRLFAEVGDEPRFFDVRTGASTPLRDADYPLGVYAYQWLDEDTAAAMGFKDDTARPDLLSCSLESRQCDVVARGFVPGLADADDTTFQLPTGRTINDD